MELVRLENVTLAYEGNIVVKDLNFSVEQGDYMLVVGENGSGKSTLMKALLGLIKIADGKISFENGLKQNQIGYLPQVSAIQKDFPASCSEVVLSGTLNKRGIKPFYSKKEKELCDKNMELLGIGDFKKRSFQDLSGGQQQRVLLARALCATSKILVLDEPVNGLDPLVTSEMYNVIKMLNKEYAITIIMVSHDVSGAVSDANKILHLYHKPLFYGTKDDYLKTQIGKRFIGGEVQ